MLKIFSVVGFLCLSSLGSYNKQSVDTTFGYKETRYFLRNSNYSRNGIYIECKIHTDNKLLSGDDSVSFELLTNIDYSKVNFDVEYPPRKYEVKGNVMLEFVFEKNQVGLGKYLDSFSIDIENSYKSDEYNEDNHPIFASQFANPGNKIRFNKFYNCYFDSHWAYSVNLYANFTYTSKSNDVFTYNLVTSCSF